MVDLGTDRSAQEDARDHNSGLSIVTKVMMVLFAVLIAWIIYLDGPKRKELNNNVNNTKQESASANIIRGNIIAQDGTLLAATNIDGDGNETRSYPYANIFAHVIGYASNGRAGLEASENYDLLSSHSSLLSQMQKNDSGEKVQGDSVVVTLSPKLQQTAYYALGSYKGAVVVIEPDSGKILAMVSKPDFDPNTISAVWDSLVSDESSSALMNRATQGLYPPGSTFKMLTALAYLREHKNDYQNFSWNCEGTLTEGDVTITCYHSEVHGSEDLEAAFANSCNTAFADIGLELDNSDLRQTAESFLFNRKLPTDLSHSASVFRMDGDSPVGEQMTTAIGQGNTLATPLHMALITSTIANGGIMMRPYLVDHIETYDGDRVSGNSPSIYKKLMTADEAEILTQFMTATATVGTAASLSGNGYTVAGKTGSAEYETNGTTGTHSWFCGFSNTEDPDIAVVVIAEDGGTGSATAVPIARQIFDAYYYG